MEQKNQIIYSLKVMRQLVESGFIPIQTMPNPKDVRYNCWVFARTDGFDQVLGMILGGETNAKIC